MIALSSLVFDPAGHVVLQESTRSKIDDVERRAVRAKTLDGDVEIIDRGYVPGDRDFRVVWSIRDRLQYLQVQRMVRMYSAVLVCTAEGAFLATPFSVGKDGRTGDLLLMVREQVL